MQMNETKDAPEDQDSDHDAILNHCAKELMEAFESKDKDKMLDAFHVLVGDLMSRMSTSDEE